MLQAVEGYLEKGQLYPSGPLIYKNCIPFPISLNGNEPKAKDKMSEKEFSVIMERGLADAKAGRARPAKNVIADIKQKIG